jgi:hypothetical protein
LLGGEKTAREQKCLLIIFSFCTIKEINRSVTEYLKPSTTSTMSEENEIACFQLHLQREQRMIHIGTRLLFKS